MFAVPDQLRIRNLDGDAESSDLQHASCTCKRQAPEQIHYFAYTDLDLVPFLCMGTRPDLPRAWSQDDCVPSIQPERLGTRSCQHGH